ncbi:MAG: transposase [Gemmataceae bacterium]
MNFPGLRAVIRVDRQTCEPDGTSTKQTRYFATSMDPSRVSAVRLLQLIRGHWSVENNLHFEKDRWWDEDRHVCHRPGLAERFTTLLSAAVSVLRVLSPGGADEPLKAQADALNWDIDRAVKLLTQ